VLSLKVNKGRYPKLRQHRLSIVSCLNPYLIYNQSRLIVDLPNEFVNISSLWTSERIERGGFLNETSRKESSVTDFETTVCLAIISVCYKSSSLLLLNPKLGAGILSLEFHKESLKRGKKFKESIT
jgi:hypothetical protein